MRVSMIVLVLLLVSTSRTSAFVPDPFTERAPGPSEPARPINRCQFSGTHVSGVVSVDMQNGTHAEIPLVDVEATIAMAPSLADVIVYVTAPLMFEGRFVARDLGGPAAYVARAYRSANRGVRIAAGKPFAITLAPSLADAVVYIPTPYGEGHVAITLPCSALTAGVPRMNMRTPSPPSRPSLITMQADTRVTATPFAGGVELAHVRRDRGDRPDVSLVGRVVSRANGFARVSFNVGPATVDGFVPDANVTDLGRGLGAAVGAGGDYVYGLRSVFGHTLVRLPIGTQVFADATVTRAWATVTRPFAVYAPTARQGARSAVLSTATDLRVHPCRFDGVMGAPSCGDRRALPRLGLARCTAEGCTDLAFVVPP